MRIFSFNLGRRNECSFECQSCGFEEGFNRFSPHLIHPRVFVTGTGREKEKNIFKTFSASILRNKFVNCVNCREPAANLINKFHHKTMICKKLLYTQIIPPDLLKIVILLGTSNWTSLFQHSVAKICSWADG